MHSHIHTYIQTYKHLYIKTQALIKLNSLPIPQQKSDDCMVKSAKASDVKATSNFF